jgi:hypothetical protein
MLIGNLAAFPTIFVQACMKRSAMGYTGTAHVVLLRGPERPKIRRVIRQAALRCIVYRASSHD